VIDIRASLRLELADQRGIAGDRSRWRSLFELDRFRHVDAHDDVQPRRRTTSSFPPGRIGEVGAERLHPVPPLLGGQPAPGRQRRQIERDVFHPLDAA
jgi:hypothetical protein